MKAESGRIKPAVRKKEYTRTYPSVESEVSGGKISVVLWSLEAHATMFDTRWKDVMSSPGAKQASDMRHLAQSISCAAAEPPLGLLHPEDPLGRAI
jgi:hypothetical protein